MGWANWSEEYGGGGDSLTTSDIICMTWIEFDLVPIYSFFYTLSILIYAKVERSSACSAFVKGYREAFQNGRWESGLQSTSYSFVQKALTLGYLLA